MNNFVVASKGRGIDPGQRQEKMFEEDGSTWLTFKYYSWPDYDYEKCLTGERFFVSPTGQGDKEQLALLMEICASSCDTRCM